MRQLVWGWVLAVAVSGTAAAQDPPCVGQGAWLQVHTAQNELALCEDGKPTATYAVTLGAKAGPKQRQGDQRTPFGRYPLLTPRVSAKFRWFIGIGYPTPEQRAHGYTGSSVGVHGPPRRVAELGLHVPRWVLGMNWTDGCVAVGSDAEIEAIVEWVQRTGAHEIVIQ